MEINEDILIRYIDGMLTEEEAVEVKNWRAACTRRAISPTPCISTP